MNDVKLTDLEAAVLLEVLQSVTNEQAFPLASLRRDFTEAKSAVVRIVRKMKAAQRTKKK